jgi:ribose transport system permease protein
VSHASTPAAPAAQSRWASLQRLVAPFVALLLLGALFTYLTWQRTGKLVFLSPESLMAIGDQASIIVIVGIGQTFVIIAGGIDLSVGSMVAFSGTLSAVLMLSLGVPAPLAILGGVASGGVFGFFNGALTAKTRLHPFIITLGSMMIIRGLAQSFTNSQNTSLLPKEVLGLATGRFPLGPGQELYVPGILILYILVLGVIAHVVLTRTRVGRYCFAIGSNAESARLSGIPTNRYLTLYFVFAGLLFGFGGIVQSARTGIGEPNGASNMELEAIAASVIGGASLSGGQGTILGTVLGALLMATLRQGLRMLNLPPYWQSVALGTAIVAAVIYDRASRRRAAAA